VRLTRALRCCSPLVTAPRSNPATSKRRWDTRITKAGVPTITVQNARRTCATLLVDPDVHLLVGG
jgi:hypothetical protein